MSERIDPDEVRDFLEAGMRDGVLVGYELVFQSTESETSRRTYFAGTSEKLRRAVAELGRLV